MNPLKQIERDVLRQAREWARAELEKELQKQADEMEMTCHQSGERLSNTRYRKMKLRTVPGIVRFCGCGSVTVKRRVAGSIRRAKLGV